MLSPRRVKHRKQFKNLHHLRGKETRGTHVSFGDYGLMATTSAWLSNREVEAARIALNRFLKRGGKVWIRIFPDKPITKKPAEVRMGKGKGAPEKWVAVVRAGRILFEVKGVPQNVAEEAMQLAAAKLSCRSRFVTRQQFRG